MTAYSAVERECFMEGGCFAATSLVEVENIPYFRTEKGSLVFTISANGHIWGHRIEDGGKKNDIELEIFYPSDGGFILRQRDSKPVPTFPTVSPTTFSSPVYEKISVEHGKVIRRILGQKAPLTALLGCIALPEAWCLDIKQNYKVRRNSSLFLRLRDRDFNGKVIDCSFRTQDQGLGTSKLGLFNVEYLDNKYTFQLSGGPVSSCILLGKSRKDGGARFGSTTVEGTMNLCREGYKLFTAGNIEFPHYVFSVSKAKDKKFFVGDFLACVEREPFPNELTVLCDTENIFDCFEIDEAMLLLEEKRLSEAESELYWTVALAQNKVMCEQRRIKSNNPNA